MNSYEIISAVATSVGVIAFAAIFTILYRGYVKASIKELRTGKRDIELVDSYIHDLKKSVKVRRTVWAVFKGICFYGLLILLLPIFAFSVYNNLSGNTTMIGDHSLMVVASGSMSEKHSDNEYLQVNHLDNQFQTYDVIILERADADDLQMYDVIAFVDNTGKNVIHRIIGENADGSFITRGDANNTNDPYSPTPQSIIGRYNNTRIPMLGALVMFFQSIGGIITLLSLFYCILMLDRFNAKLRNEENDRLEQVCSAIDLDLDHKSGDISAEFVETLYYKGYVYHFNEKGFVGKEEISDAAYLEKSNSAAIRIKNDNGVRSETEILIGTERRDEETP